MVTMRKHMLLCIATAGIIAFSPGLKAIQGDGQEEAPVFDAMGDFAKQTGDFLKASGKFAWRISPFVVQNGLSYYAGLRGCQKANCSGGCNSPAYYNAGWKMAGSYALWQGLKQGFHRATGYPLAIPQFNIAQYEYEKGTEEQKKKYERYNKMIRGTNYVVDIVAPILIVWGADSFQQRLNKDTKTVE